MIWWILLAAVVLLGIAVGGAVFMFHSTHRRVEKKPLTPEQQASLSDRDTYLVSWWKLVEETEEWGKAIRSEAWEIASFDGLRLSARLFSPREPSHRIALCVHGYHSSGYADFNGIAPFYLEQGFHVLLVDDRAHGGSEGDYLGFGWLDRLDCKAWCEELVRRFGEDCSILLHGVSMGSATVLSAAGENLPEQVLGVVGDCGYSSAWEEYRHVMHRDYHLPAFPILHLASAVCKLKLGFWFRENSAVEQLKKSALPLLLIHGDQDDFVPTHMSAKLLAASGDPDKKLVLIPGAQHANSYQLQPKLYQEALIEFFHRIDMDQ